MANTLLIKKILAFGELRIHHGAQKSINSRTQFMKPLIMQFSALFSCFVFRGSK